MTNDYWMLKVESLRRESDQLRTVLKDNRTWLKAALTCKDFRWDPDQYAAAESCIKEADRLLGTGL